ncbi:RNA-binding protein NOB1-like [Amphibalanus amphitrite]|uniref:RNA-binding protein NOB1-like n=1 Tax=Amphibalanus amphitrite TaxID=1232801 RepID=UPI001C91D0E2|nr:RNA-binding protein NOB1-like [Amphibalanus amphitrite]XP_043233496.1 RNA-binding protein NOB1-like [Amphibalanus amphitrite]XP_043233497.1 RNA-binding protein NOB1-like [Amphibalanus amphitrite]XP_043233498.1 RNA-binding protein NOB1-like [Amphibalanus amphitrite]
MIQEPYIDNLVADSGAFLRNVPLHHMAKNVLTVPEVVSEIRDKATRDRLQVLPYELKLKEPSDECIRQISDFARKTGELRFLSATDVRVLALALQVTRETVGGGHIRLLPAASRTDTKLYHPREHKLGQLPVGFVEKVGELAVTEDDEKARGDGEQVGTGTDAQDGDKVKDGDGKAPAPGGDETAGEREEGKRGEAETDDPNSEEMFDAKEDPEEGDTDEDAEETEIKETKDTDAIESQEGDEEDGDEQQEEEVEEEEEEDEDDGWITPGNIQAAKNEMNAQAGEVEEPVKVACMTTDFTMQNVLKQMNLELVSIEGRRIREVRRFVLRCFGCFQVTPHMDKTFCPWCGNKTLKRVSVTLRADGSQEIHISTRKPISKRGTKYSLPLPRGGKYSVQPVLCEDQPLPQQRATARSQARNAILSDDFVQGGSPFSLNDVNSRAAQLGRNSRFRQVPNWERRNPNARAPPTGNKKKRRK